MRRSDRRAQRSRPEVWSATRQSADNRGLTSGRHLLSVAPRNQRYAESHGRATSSDGPSPVSSDNPDTVDQPEGAGGSRPAPMLYGLSEDMAYFYAEDAAGRSLKPTPQRPSPLLRGG